MIVIVSPCSPLLCVRLAACTLRLIRAGSTGKVPYSDPCFRSTPGIRRLGRDLDQQSGQVAQRPGLGEPTIGDPHDVGAAHVEPPATRSYSRECAGVGSAQPHPHGDPIVLADDILDSDLEVWERRRPGAQLRTQPVASTRAVPDEGRRGKLDRLVDLLAVDQPIEAAGYRRRAGVPLISGVLHRTFEDAALRRVEA
jgi:hypothetical protein